MLGVSTDSVESHRAFADEHRLPFPLLADTEQRVTGAYGVDTTLGYADRVTFLIAADGRVARVFPDVDPGVHCEEVLAAITPEVRLVVQHGTAHPVDGVANVECDPFLAPERFRSLLTEAAAVVCEPQGVAVEAQPTLPLGEALWAAKVGELIGAEVHCFDCELDAGDAAARLREEGAASAPVVDDHGVLVGNVHVKALDQLCDEARELQVDDRAAERFDGTVPPLEPERARSQLPPRGRVLRLE